MIQLYRIAIAVLMLCSLPFKMQAQEKRIEILVAGQKREINAESINVYQTDSVVLMVYGATNTSAVKSISTTGCDHPEKSPGKQVDLHKTFTPVVQSGGLRFAFKAGEASTCSRKFFELKLNTTDEAVKKLPGYKPVYRFYLKRRD